MSIKFSSPTLHGTAKFAPGISTAFEDADAEPYFIAAFGAETTDEPPVMTYSLGEVDIDPQTIFGNGPQVGQLVISTDQEA